LQRLRVVALMGISALIGVPALAGAQQDPQSTADTNPQHIQEQVVVTGSLAPAPLGNLGRGVFVIPAADIEALPFDSVVDALRLLSSVDVRARGPFGAQTDFSVRGTNYGQTLVMVDGARLNDAQAGHHNGDLPVPLAAVDRIEVLPGGGSSLHGADAFGGTINIITRRSLTGWRADLSGGSFDLLDTSASGGINQGTLTHTLAASFSRSSGFIADRDHKVFSGSYRLAAGDRTSIFVGNSDKEFGAAGYYGPAPSREWTTQTLVNVDQRVLRRDRVIGTVDAFYRTHSDHFIYDQTRPSLSENRHRTHAIGADVKLRFTASEKTELSVGAAAGSDWVRSTNLGDHDFGRGSVFAELQQHLGDRVILSPGIRFDAYNTFGSSWSPSLAISAWSSPRVKWRAATGHAFRVPTFTELYYHDPNNRGSADLKPERAWTADGGADLFLARGWSAGATVFGRWEDNVIDWLRDSPTVPWVSTNVRDVRSRGIETSLRRTFGGYGMASVQYTWQHLSADSLGTLSKYVLDYSTRSLALMGAAHVGPWSAGPRLEYKHRIDGRAYWVLDARVGRRFGDWEIFADAANLLDQQYQEISGVAMPGRWAKLGIRRR
jgi:iron complex outermembrane recepter protein